MRHSFFVALVAIATLLPASAASAANSSRGKILHDAHVNRCGSEAPCDLCYWPVTAPYKFVNNCDAGGAAPGSECRCKSQAGWQPGEVRTSYPDKPIASD